jgi:DNA (cytosine-5)-methyltransferase 1
LNELALFAGGGGGLLGSKLLGWRTVCYVENNDYAVEIIKARIRDGILDDAPIWDDVRTFDGRPWAGSVDIVTAGFPCQPYSSAGKGRAENDERNLWPDTARIIGEVRPRRIMLENVSRLVHYEYFGEILSTLSVMGYGAIWGTFQGTSVGSPQLRKRIFLVDHTHGVGLYPHAVQQKIHHEKRTNQEQEWWNGKYYRTDDQKLWRIPEFEFLGMDYGIPHWMDRIRAIGNGQIPAVVRTAWNELSENRR